MAPLTWSMPAAFSTRRRDVTTGPSCEPARAWIFQVSTWPGADRRLGTVEGQAGAPKQHQIAKQGSR